MTELVLPREPAGNLTMTPKKVNQLRARLHQYSQKEKWTDEERGVVLGTLGYIRAVYPTKTPSKLRQLVEHIEARVRAERLARQVEIPAPPPAEGAPAPKPKRRKLTKKSKSATIKDYCGESLPLVEQ